ncbi:MAG TPA: hypothetical protein VGC32_13105 [Solirubrobacterales bacterium]
MGEARVRTLEAELDLGDLLDPGAMAEAVGDELGGGWGGEGPVQWPHDCWVELAPDPIRFITVVVADESQMDGVLGRIEATLRRDSRWKVLSIRSRPVSRFESEVAMELVRVPRL